ncbi:hypothetical protein [Nonomuraea sp. NPDC049480]|uniref:hypothetical protein n=1 Tax=Nonomuraea sp. NPDC049480 TaxID=3364353 RepID=UPI00378EBD6C
MRGMAAAGTVLIAAAVNVATGMLTQRWDVAWWAATGVLVVVGGGLQWWLTYSTGDPARFVTASGDGAIAGGRDVRGVSTKVFHPAWPVTRPDSEGEGVIASGQGAVAAGGDVVNAHTEVGAKAEIGLEERPS